jgi:hypothetical protein
VRQLVTEALLILPLKGEYRYDKEKDQQNTIADTYINLRCAVVCYVYQS